MTDKLFTPTKLGDIKCRPCGDGAADAQSRAGTIDRYDGGVLPPARQRGLIISEGAQVSRLGQGYAWTPGIWTEAQGAGWRKITDAVHAEGGKIVAQLWHGPVSHPLCWTGRTDCAFGIDCSAKTFDGTGFVNVPTRRALALDGFGRGG